MSNWSLPPRLDPDDELRAADLLLGKADALLRRHRAAEPQAPLLPEPEEFVSLEDDDLPVLTEVVDPSEWETSSQVAQIPPAPAAPTTPVQVSQLAEQLISLDTEISRAVEAWFATELPQLLSREMDKLSSRLQEEAIAHLRATLLPTLSEHISRSLEKHADLPR
ncbi:hypothetical protein [Aromatoleum diolicum]|uniref:DUF2497 domain-containing protein n=1 Tax=Aromatoleum diolicum TaxID=75796 RepID=A0ABX1Q907_9RHOO|nr:hypothetical protein [Aromatoleum diolicum]NMG73511.1 hypothetical protein [Aromatoleum diolicum]